MDSSFNKVSASLLSRQECNIIRGLAILLIVLNNFGHKINGVHMDNEFRYKWKNVIGFIDSLSNPSDILPLDILSFYSPYGVMLFIFLSGYGLSLKYEKGNGQHVTNSNFIFDHYKKLFIMQAKGLALFLFVYFLYYKSASIDWGPFVRQLFMIENLNPWSKIKPGPYWFFGMIMEVYIVYRMFFYRRSSLLMVVIVAFSLVVMSFFDPKGAMMRYLRINLGMALLPFCMGVLVARHWNRKMQYFISTNTKCLLWFVISFVLLSLCKFNFYSWLFMPIFIVATSIMMVKLFLSKWKFALLFSWLGGLSGVIFVIHPILRLLLVHRANESGHYYAIMFIYLFMTIVLGMILRPVFMKE